jgi:hypothetical protein
MRDLDQNIIAQGLASLDNLLVENASGVVGGEGDGFESGGGHLCC